MKKNTNFWIVLVIFSLVGQVAWVVENMYFNVFIYNMFNATAEDISLMVALSAVSATVTTLFMGALSDKLGKRKVFMAGGYIAWGITILAFALIRKDLISSVFGVTSSVSAICITLVIILDVVMTFFGSTANDAAFNAWLTDETDITNRGKAEGINSMMPLVAILVVFGGFMSFDLTLDSSWAVIFIILGALVVLMGVIGFFLIEEKTVKVNENGNYFANIFYGFKIKVVKENVMLYLSLLAFSIFGISIQIFMPYLILYYTETLKMANYVLIMAPAIILASVFTVFYGRLFDKIAFEKSIFGAILILSIGYIILYMFTNTALVFIGSLLMMCGYLGGMAVFGATIRNHTPENKAGMFQGLRIFAQVLIPGVIGPYIGALVLKNAEKVLNSDGTTSFIPNKNIFLAALIVAIILTIILAVIFYFNNKKKKN